MYILWKTILNHENKEGEPLHLSRCSVSGNQRKYHEIMLHEIRPLLFIFTI